MLVKAKNVERLARVVKVVGRETGLERGAEVKARDGAERLAELGLKVSGAAGGRDGVGGLRRGHVGHDAVGDRVVERICLHGSGDSDLVFVALHVFGGVPSVLSVRHVLEGDIGLGIQR